MWARLQDYVLQEWRVIQRAPGAFAACLVAGLLLSGFGIWGAFSWAYGSVLSQKDATIESQRNRIDGLEATVRELRSSSPSPPATAVRDPDGIFQFGQQVGSVKSAQVDESRGIAQFGAIVGAVKFNADSNFEYRDFVLHVKGFAAETRASVAGQAGRSLVQVTSEIVGRVSYQ